MDFTPLWDGGPLFSPDGAAPLTTDSVLLADFVRVPECGSGCELCCGSGVIALLLLQRSEKLRMDCVELLPAACGTARGNFAANGYSSRAGVICGDIRNIRCLLPAGGHGLVVCNPPYFPEGGGRAPSDALRAAARTDTSCSLRDVCSAAAWLLRTGGAFCLCYRTDRIAELFSALTGSGLEPKRLRTVQYSKDKPPKIALVEARRGGRPGCSFEPALLLTENGEPSDEARRIYHQTREAL